MQTAEDLPVKKRIFVQRDFSDGMVVKFQSKFPVELDNRIDRDVFEMTIVKLNQMYQEAEEVSASSYCEGCLACLTGYTLLLCVDTHYKKVLKKISKYIDKQNKEQFWPHRVVMKDPFENGLRSIEFIIYETGENVS
ncbi:golgin subfamily A member 7-like [Clavelina lepadiformis]|uniref:Ras modification protein ERF4 n=1 Tax=Clavelina lepadiformis TaxID=159417 RepID=A0ABP0FMP2_CLALP